jgi:hypothetical protein
MRDILEEGRIHLIPGDVVHRYLILFLHFVGNTFTHCSYSGSYFDGLGQKLFRLACTAGLVHPTYWVSCWAFPGEFFLIVVKVPEKMNSSSVKWSYITV